MYCQNLLEIALVLAEHDPTYEDMATKFFEHFALIASALNEKGLWNEEDGFYYDMLHTARRPTTSRCACARSSGCSRSRAVTTLGPDDAGAAARLLPRASSGSRANRPEAAAVVAAHGPRPSTRGWRMLSIVDEERLRRLLAAMLDPDEFLSDHGLRALSRYHEASPLRRRRSTASIGDARLRARRVDERPLRRQLELARPDLVPGQLPARRVAPRYHRYLGDDFTVEFPTGSGRS